MIVSLVLTALQEAWHAAFGWMGVDIMIGIAATLVAIFLPKQLDFITDLRKWAVVVAALAFTSAGLIAHGYRLGLDEKQRQWDAALVRELELGEKARDAAERSVGAVTTDRRLFDDDPDNRDRLSEQDGAGTQGPVRWMAPHHLFRKN